MRFRDLKRFNTALLAKQLWRLITKPDSLVAKVFKAKYYKDGEWLKDEAKAGCLYVWRSIIGSKKIIEGWMKWIVGSGEKISVYEDMWVNGSKSGKVSGKEGSKNMNTTVASLLNEEGQWDKSKREELFHDHEKEWILSTPIRER